MMLARRASFLLVTLCIISQASWPLPSLHSVHAEATLGKLSLSRNSDAPWAPFALNGTPFSDIDSISSLSSAPFKVAFIADLVLRPEFETAGLWLLKMVAREKVDVTFLSGDLDYLEVDQHQPERIGQRRTYPTTSLKEYDSILGKSHTIFTVFGNHEVQSEVLFQPQPAYPDEPTYASIWQARMERLRLNDTCVGWVGGDSVCSIPGRQALVVSSNIAVADEPHRLLQRRSEHEAFISAALSEYSSRARWRICQWHVPEALLNTGNVPRSAQDDPGLKIYNACIKAGAIIVTGHDHAYARTRSLKSPIRSVKNRKGREEIATHDAPYYYEATSSRAELLVLSEGSSFAFVNGLGGLEIRPPVRGKDRKRHWARLKNASPDQKGRAAQLRDTAALLCTFGEIPPSNIFDGFPRTRDAFIRAYDLPPKVADRIGHNNWEEQCGWCVLKTANGQIEDKFALLSVVKVVAPKPLPLAEAVELVPPNSEPVEQVPSADATVVEVTPDVAHATVTDTDTVIEMTPLQRPQVSESVESDFNSAPTFHSIFVMLSIVVSGLILTLCYLLKSPTKGSHVS